MKAFFLLQPILCLIALAMAQTRNDSTMAGRDSVPPSHRCDTLKNVPAEYRIPLFSGGSVTLDQIGKTRIVLKDGTMKVACTLKKIHADWIEYEKNGGLHDMTIDRIQRIETYEAPRAIVFDEKNNPRMIEWEP